VLLSKTWFEDDVQVSFGGGGAELDVLFVGIMVEFTGGIGSKFLGGMVIRCCTVVVSGYLAYDTLNLNVS
jgi:hypothetical protein